MSGASGARGSHESTQTVSGGGGGGPRLPAAVSFFSVPSAERIAEMKAAGPPPSLNAFLATARRYVTDSTALADALSACPHLDQMRVHVVVGNEASDMDSMVSAVTLAWYLSLLHPPATGNVFVPLINIPRDQLVLRGEAEFSFRQAGVEPALLLFLDDMEWAALQRRAALAAVLVDHNNLAHALQPVLSPFVVGILDHHRDEGLYPLTKECDNRRIVVPVGSCTSIVGDVIIRAAPWLLSPDSLPAEVDAEKLVLPAALSVLTLLHHTVLLDTQNMSEKAGKAEKLDREMLDVYRTNQQDICYAELHRRRVNVRGLSTPQMLLKDAKYGESRVYPYVISSVPGSLAEWCARDEQLLPHVEAFARAQRLRFVLLLTSFTDPKDRKYKREIVLLVPKDIPAGVAGSTGPDAPVGAQPAAAAASAGGSDQSSAGSDSHPNVSLHAPASGSAVLVERSPNVQASGPPIDSEALVSALDAALMAAVDHLDCCAEPTLLTAGVLDQKHDMIIKSYAQNKVTGSRKQVTPVIEGVISKL